MQHIKLQEPNQRPRRRHYKWIFWTTFGITMMLTLTLIGIVVWLVKTQSIGQLYIGIGIIASIIAVVSAPLLFFFNVFKPPEKQQQILTPSHELASSVLSSQTNALFPSPQSPAEASNRTSAQINPKPIWNVPYLRNPYFTGREDIINRLHKMLTTTKTITLTQRQAISGLGGVGKTQIAVEYAYLHQSDYSFVLWVNAATRDTIIASFLELANLLALPQQQEPDQNIIIAAVKRWFTMHDKWLLLFDNADDLSLAEEFLPVSDTGHLLLTTRDQAPGTLANSLDVETMNRNEGTLLLLRRAKKLPIDSPLEYANSEERTQAEYIVEELGGLPLALDQAAAYSEETQCSLFAYREQYHRQQAKFLRRRGRTGKDHPFPIATTWTLSFTQVQLSNPLAADLLRVCAFLAPDAIPEEMLIAGAAELGPKLAKLKDDPTQLDEAIGILRRFSLLRRHTEERTLSIHRLIQAVLQMEMDTSTSILWAERAVRTINITFPNVTITTLQQCERVLPHALKCARLIETFTLALPEAARLLDQTGSYLKERGQYKEAEPLFRRALTIREQMLGPLHPDTAQSLNNLAELCYSQGKYEEAEPLFRRALTIREQMLGPLHPDTAQSLNSLAVLFRNQGRDAEAEPLYLRALNIRKQMLGPLHPDTAQSLDSLAVFYYGQGKYEEAWSLYKRALAISEQVLGPLHPDTARSLNSLAVLFRSQGKDTEAESLFRRALAIREQVLGPNHPDTAQSLNNLAELCYSQGNNTEAEPLFRRALTIKEQVLGPQHPSTARSLNSLAVLFRSQGKDTEAESLFRRALAIREQVLGPQHCDTAQSLNNLAELYGRQEKDAEAESLFQRALAIREKVLGPQHPSTARTLNNLAELYENQGKDAEAESLFRRALTIREKVLGPQHPSTQQVRANYTRLQLKNSIT